jgi:hypothetical protein
MDQRLEMESPQAVRAGNADQQSRLVAEASGQYVARWARLVSTTNWEKGRIICEWREALIQAGAPPDGYTDEAWSCGVGGVSPRHVGRLRRVYQRFGQVYPQYGGLHWSHFQAASEWPDAEMWLEGAVQNGWSVAAMRDQRWQALGAPPRMRPRDEDVITTELDEDFAPVDRLVPEVISTSLGIVQEAQPVAQRKSEASPPEAAAANTPQRLAPPTRGSVDEPFRPFEDFSPLPADLNRAFQAFRRAIRRHRLSGWRKVSLGDVLAVLDALKQLALAPAEQ